jgi:antitoxin ParD1/3/4
LREFDDPAGLGKRARYSLIQAAQERRMADDRIEITLEDEAIVAFVRGKVRSGEYASEADVVRESLETLRHQAAELERWEREVVVPAYDHLMADPSSTIPIEQVERHLEERRKRRHETLK